MSSTNRGTERAENDRYMTPERVAATCVHRLWFDGWLSPNHPLDLLEPHAGAGSFVAAMRQHFPRASITAADIVDDSDRWQSVGASRVHVGDFLTDTPQPDVWAEWDAIVGNPPYASAEAHVRRALGRVVDHGGIVAMLLPLSFLESQTRIPFWREHPAACIYVLAERPSFTGKGTDSNAYGFFIWQSRRVKYPTRLEVISWR